MSKILKFIKKFNMYYMLKSDFILISSKFGPLCKLEHILAIWQKFLFVVTAAIPKWRAGLSDQFQKGPTQGPSLPGLV